MEETSCCLFDPVIFGFLIHARMHLKNEYISATDYVVHIQRPIFQVIASFLNTMPSIVSLTHAQL